MKICAAQTKPITGRIEINIENHLHYVDKAVSNRAHTIIFSELSLTGYEPTLAKELAVKVADERFEVFQQRSNEGGITIGVGIPTVNGNGFSISMMLFRPNKPRLVYSKKYLHPDEDEFFIPGKNFPSLRINDTIVGLAICYELSIPEHSKAAHNNGAQLYIASVAKFERGVKSAIETLSGIAIEYSMPTIMINAIGPADHGICSGNSSVWNKSGKLAGQLNDSSEGMLIFDTVSEKSVAMTL